MLYNANPKSSTNPSAMNTARVFARNFMTRGLRHAFGMTRSCRPSNGFGVSFGQRAFLIEDCKRAFSPGHRSPKEVCADCIAARRARHQICACRPALRAKITVCRVRLRKKTRICSEVTRAWLVAAPAAESALKERGSSAEDNLGSECPNALSRLAHMEL